MIIFLTMTEEERDYIERYYIDYGEAMMRVALGILKNKFDAEVAIQESFRGIIEAMQSFRHVPDDKKKYYCLTVARNVSLKILRTKTIGTPVSELEWLEDTEAHIEDLVIMKEDIAMVRKLIGGLDEKYRVPLLLRYYNFMSYQEIAALLGIKDVNARKRVSRALEQLSALYKKEGGVTVGN